MGTFFQCGRNSKTSKDEVKILYIVCSVQLWPVQAFHLWKPLGQQAVHIIERRANMMMELVEKAAGWAETKLREEETPQVE